MKIQKHPDNVRVSAIIPTCNRRGFVCEAVESVLQQTYPHYELIVVDDGSDDGTEEALHAFGDRIRYIRQENRGVSAARNRGIAASRGACIAFLDSDDLWHQTKLEKQMAYFAAHPESKIGQTDEVWLRHGRWANPKKKHHKPSGWIFDACLPRCVVSPSSVIIHREVFETVGVFDEDLPACEDYDMWLRISPYYPVHLIPEKLITKRGGHEDQLSRKIWGLDRFRIDALEKLLLHERLSKKQKDEVTQELVRKIHIFAGGCLKRGKTDVYRVYQDKLKKLQEGVGKVGNLLDY